MDIIKATEQTRKPWLALSLAIIGLLIFSGFQLTRPSSNIKVSRADIWVSEVERGDLPLMVEGFGKLKSKYQRLLTAPTDGIVEEILLKPGAPLTPDTLLLRLTNANMDQKVIDAEIEVQKQQATIRELTSNQKIAVLERESNQAQLQAQWEEATLKVEAQTILAEKGIISALDFKSSQLALEKMRLQLELERARIEHLTLAHKDKLISEQERLKQLDGQLKLQRDLRDSLEVRAGITGVLQRLDVSLGQSVTPATQLALVGSTVELIAELQVPQNQAQRIEIGHPAVVDTRGGTIAGKVTRIDPVVVDGSILVAIELPESKDDLPDNARPDLNVEGEINIGTLEDVLYMRRPAGVNAQTSGSLFKLDRSMQRALNTRLGFGAISDQYIQILQGAEAGDRFIASDSARWQDYPELSITN